MMDLTTVMNNAAVMKNNTTADTAIINSKVTTELAKFVTANNNYDAMKAGLINANKAANKADPTVKLITPEEADAQMLAMGLQKVDLVAKENELRARITEEENAKAKSEFYNLLEETTKLTAALEAKSAPIAPQESDLDKLIKLQVLQMSQQQNQQSSNSGEECFIRFIDALGDAIKNESTAPAASTPAPAPAPSYYRPSNREQYESHKAITRSKSAERGQLYADMKAGRISLGQYMAGCAATWTDAASEHADVTSRRRGYYI